ESRVRCVIGCYTTSEIALRCELALPGVTAPGRPRGVPMLGKVQGVTESTLLRTSACHGRPNGFQSGRNRSEKDFGRPCRAGHCPDGAVSQPDIAGRAARSAAGPARSADGLGPGRLL